jgi:HEAT repeat protein
MGARSRPSSRGLYVFVALFMVVTVVTCLGIAHQDLVLVTYHLFRFDQSTGSDDQSGRWLAEQPSLSLSPLVSKLRQSDPAVCLRSGKLLGEILHEHGDPTNPEHAQLSLHLASLLQKGYTSFSEPGKKQAIHLAYGILEQHLNEWSPNVASALETAGDVIKFAMRDINQNINLAALDELPSVWQWKGVDNVAENLFREWKIGRNQRVVDFLDSKSTDVRLAAIRALDGAIDHRGDAKLLELMNDPDPNVCRAALDAIVSTAIDSVGVDHRAKLVELMQHASPEISALARTILLRSGLDEAHLRLAVLMRDQAPAERAKVAEVVFDVAGVDRVLVLQQLSKDASPIVRLAAVRASTRVTHPSLKEMVKQLSADDPDPEVRRACEMILTEASADRRRS